MRMSFILLIIAALFFTIGIFISKFKWYWLISGYNTMNEEEKAKVEIESFRKAYGENVLYSVNLKYYRLPTKLSL